MIAQAAASGPGVYQTVMGGAFTALHPNVRAAHLAPLTATGTIDVVHGSHPLTQPFVWLLNLPAAGPNQSVSVHVADHPRAGHREMLWSRAIGEARLSTIQSARQGRLLERIWPGSVEFVLREEGGSLVYEQCSFRLLNVPIWRGAAPHVTARVSPAAAGWHVAVAIRWRGHLVCRYEGTMHFVQDAP